MADRELSNPLLKLANAVAGIGLYESKLAPTGRGSGATLISHQASLERGKPARRFRDGKLVNRPKKFYQAASVTAQRVEYSAHAGGTENDGRAAENLRNARRSGPVNGILRRGETNQSSNGRRLVEFLGG